MPKPSYEELVAMLKKLTDDADIVYMGKADCIQQGIAQPDETWACKWCLWAVAWRESDDKPTCCPGKDCIANKARTLIKLTEIGDNA